jgi:hypothetical protein
MNHMKIFMTESGFSMVQGMMLAAAVAGSSLVATRLLTDQKLAQKSAETRDQVEQLHKLVYSTLQDKDACTRTLFTGTPGILGQSPGNLALIPNPQRVNSKVGATVVEQFSLSNQRYMNNNVILDKMVLTYPGSATATLKVFYQRLTNDLAGTKKLKEGYGAKDIAKTINLKIQRDPLYKSGGIQTFPYTSCYAVTADSDGTANGEDGNDNLNETMCAQLNSGESGATGSFFEWDPTTATCKPKENVCKNVGEVNTGINSNGQVECRRITEWMDTSKMIDQSSAMGCAAGQYVKVNTSGGKIKIECSNSP